MCRLQIVSLGNGSRSTVDGLLGCVLICSTTRPPLYVDHRLCQNQLWKKHHSIFLVIALIFSTVSGPSQYLYLVSFPSLYTRANKGNLAPQTVMTWNNVQFIHVGQSCMIFDAMHRLLVYMLEMIFTVTGDKYDRRKCNGWVF